MGNEYVESFDGRGTAILGCHTWLLAFQHQPAIHNLGAHIRGMPGLRQGILILAPHNVVHRGHGYEARTYKQQISPGSKRFRFLKFHGQRAANVSSAMILMKPEKVGFEPDGELSFKWSVALSLIVRHLLAGARLRRQCHRSTPPSDIKAKGR